MFKIQTLLLAISITLIIAISIFVQVLLGFDTTVLNPNYYNNLIEKHHLYELPQNYVLLNIKENSDLLLSEPICNVLNPSISVAFSDEWAKYQSEKTINNTINYIKGNEDELKLEVILKDRKEYLADDITNSLNTKYNPEELAVFKIDSAEKAASIIMESTNLPDSINIATMLNVSEKGFLYVVNTLKQYYNVIKFVPYLLLVLLVALLIFIGKNGLGIKWLGYSFVISACLTVIGVFIASIYLDNFLADNISKQSDLLTTIGTNPYILASIIKNSLIIAIKKISFISGLIGAILFLWGKFRLDKYQRNLLASEI